jgi:hypothetical protein
MKDIKGLMGEMKMPLKPISRPVKQRPYRSNPKYKQKVKIELDRMLEVEIIKPVEESKWIIPSFTDGFSIVGKPLYGLHQGSKVQAELTIIKSPTFYQLSLLLIITPQSYIKDKV